MFIPIKVQPTPQSHATPAPAAAGPTQVVPGFNALAYRLSVSGGYAGGLQARLTTSSPSDHAEREADGVAASIMHMPDGPHATPAGSAQQPAAGGPAWRQIEEEAGSDSVEDEASDMPEG